MNNSIYKKKIREKSVSGRYRSSGRLSLELRVDIDGYRPMNKVSGDFFITRGKNRYLGSFISDITKKPKTKSTNVTLEGKCKFTWDAQFSNIQIILQRKLKKPGMVCPAFFVSVSYLLPHRWRPSSLARSLCTPCLFSPSSPPRSLF